MPSAGRSELNSHAVTKRAKQRFEGSRKGASGTSCHTRSAQAWCRSRRQSLAKSYLWAATCGENGLGR